MSTSPNENPGEAQPADFDPTRVAMLMEMEDEGDSSMMKDISAQFVEDITTVLSRIESAVASGDCAPIAGAAHTVKGSAATFGLYRVEKLAKQLEAAAKNSAQSELAPIYASLCEAFVTGQAALTKYFEGK